MNYAVINDEIAKLELEIENLHEQYEMARQLDSVFREKKSILSTIRKLSERLINLRKALIEDDTSKL